MKRQWMRTACVAALVTAPAFLAGAEAVTLAGKGAQIVLDGGGRGVASLKTPDGVELAAVDKAPQRLFSLTVSRQAEPPGEPITVGSWDARAFSMSRVSASAATLTYADFSNGVERAVCTVSADPDGLDLRWRIEVVMRDGWVLENVSYPQITLAASLGAAADDDAMVVGASKGGVTRKPGSLKKGQILAISQPGSMSAQFGCYYDARAGFYTAAYDDKGYPKSLIVTRTDAGVEFTWSRPCFATGADSQAYDVAVSTFTGPAGAPADWRDAADRYRAWAWTRHWCAKTLTQRDDLPAWLKDAPAMVRFGRNWLSDPDGIERWLTGFWQKHFPKAPLITAYWGWEKLGSWVTPDYFPVYPSDEQFTRLVARTRALGCHAFPWPSGYHWTLTYVKRDDGSFEWDDRARFDTLARKHAVHNRDGQMYLRTPGWLRGGNTACLCGGDPWTRRWWNEDICAPLARRGCEMIQVDQVVGANWPACYADWHGHPRGRGRWMTEAFTEQLTGMREAMRKIEPDAVVCIEEPNEWFNHLMGLQDYRNCERKGEWASVFNYIYHEYLPPFQSNPRRGNRVWDAHCLADGQIPHMVPSGKDFQEVMLANGGFDGLTADGTFFRDWGKLSGYKDAVWNGAAHVDTEEKHSGVASMRLENKTAGDTVQVSQNVAAEAESFGGGRTYRLSAWLKTGKLARPNGINFGVFAPGLKSTGQGGQLKFPAPGSGWQKVAADFTMPDSAEMLRIMCHVSGEAVVWVDEMRLEEVLADGSVKEVVSSGFNSDARFMRRWVELYHGEGRPWLAHGRLMRQPALECAKIEYDGRQVPAVFHNAFRAADGREAVVLANATREPQAVTLTWGGRSLPVTVAAHDAVLVKR